MQGKGMVNFCIERKLVSTIKDEKGLEIPGKRKKVWEPLNSTVYASVFSAQKKEPE